MKILVVNDQFQSGGAGRVAATMCNELVKRGHGIHVVTDNQNNVINYHLDGEIVIHTVSFKADGRSSVARLASLFKTARRIRPVIKNVRPDVIIAIQANGFIRTLIANQFSGIPLIAADHTSFSRKMDLINTLTRHYLYKYADGLSILTKRDEKLLGAKYPKKRVIYNPLTYPILTKSTTRNKTILCAGRFDIWKIKGFDYIIKIWAQLAAKHPQWMLEFAGTGSEENLSYIKRLVVEHYLENRVCFLGQVSNMEKLYARTGIFALPSRIEGFPMVLLEAMSQGCPCVAFNVGGASEEMIVDNSGYVIADGNLDAFRDALDDLMTDDEKRMRFSALALHSVEKFSVENHVKAWEDLIKQTIKNKRQ